jgi:hypothetical protein
MQIKKGLELLHHSQHIINWILHTFLGIQEPKNDMKVMEGTLPEQLCYGSDGFDFVVKPYRNWWRKTISYGFDKTVTIKINPVKELLVVVLIQKQKIQRQQRNGYKLFFNNLKSWN